MNAEISNRRSRLLLTCALVVMTLSACADLRVARIHTKPGTAALGDQVWVTVKNAGNRDAQTSKTQLWKKTPTDTAFVPHGVGNTPMLRPGEQDDRPINFAGPLNLSSPGQCAEFKACADSEGVVFEGFFWEINNCETISRCRP